MAKRIKVAQLVGNLETGGTQTLLIELMRRLDRARFDCSLLYLKTPNHFEDEIRQKGWVCHRARVTREYRFADLRRLAQMLRRMGIDILHCHSDFANFAGRASGVYAGVPHLVAHLHNTYEHRLDEGFLEMERKLAPFTDAYISCSRGVEAFANKNIDMLGRPNVLVRNGIDLDPFEDAWTKRAEARQRFLVPKDVFHIVHTARMERHKQPHKLLEALALGVRKGAFDRPWRLTFVGGGSERELLEERLMSLDAEFVRHGLAPISPHIVFAGWSREIAMWLATADVFCLVSRNEGLPLSLVEAMAAGAATIASDIVGPREVIRHEVDGLLVDGSDAEQVLEGLVRLYRDVEFRNKLVASGRERAREFRIERFVEEVEAIYSRVAASPTLNPGGISARVRRTLFFMNFVQTARHARSERKLAGES